MIITQTVAPEFQLVPQLIYAGLGKLGVSPDLGWSGFFPPYDWTIQQRWVTAKEMLLDLCKEKASLL
ncbi:hypothetical protein Y1Q_0023456 [Alligator mississippiensis]|uniref:Uncharacterized protein n=1 Tax=Alligator mississippiensis TaxID=8496 RepID=A0A151NPY0_ALLMI|nr:hypothetical protein Y1Q_0023456 [Alligator mississippiensis]